MRFSKIMLHANRALEAQNSMTHRSSWRLGTVAGAIALVGSLSITPVHALGLGRITIQSALGEALRAEIDVPEITAEEAASLRVGVAAPAAFKAAGLEYSPIVVGVQINLQKRADGRSYLSLTSPKPVTEPFVDLVLEASWASGRVVRDYTMLFDPPNLRQAGSSSVSPTVNQTVNPTAPVVPRPSTPLYPSPPPVASAEPVTPRLPRAEKPLPPTPARKAATSPAKPATTGQQVTVKTGDTAGRIAAQNKPVSISLDQMLVALLNSNPSAFIGGNINRLKSGAVLNIPAAEDAAALPAAEASRTIVAQSKNFNDFRQKLAAGVPSTQIESANRQASGAVQAKVEDRAAATVPPDKLTLSKGAVQGKAAAEDKIAKDKQAKDTSSRVAELSKNLGDLNKIANGAPAATVAPAASASAAKAPGLAVPSVPMLSTPAATPQSAAASAAKPSATAIVPSAPAATVAASAAATPSVASTASPTVAGVSSTALTTASPTLVASSASATLTAAAPVAAASAPAAIAPVPMKKPVVAPPPEPGLMDDLTDNPLVLPGLGALLALLAGFGFYRFKKRNSPAAVDSSFLESRLQPDSFFGASGGQRIDTSESSNATGSSMVYSPSQLDAAGDVDPVAEADVYLAYGRDLQAEEILKEALRTNPSRVAIHAKLMEIYAKRRDLKASELIASEAFSLTNGNGPEWAYICEMGRELDPNNPVYQPGGQPQNLNREPPAMTPAMAASYGADTIPHMMVRPPGAADSAVDFDLDLDFSADDAAPVATQIASPALAHQPEQTASMRPADPNPIFNGLDMDFSADTIAAMPPVASSASSAEDNSLSFDLDSARQVIRPAAAATAPAALNSGMLEFDMSALSLDLDAPITESPPFAKAASKEPAVVEGPLETKFALAEEFRALGDPDGARSLANEVAAQAQGALKTKAQAFLNTLS